MVFLEVLLHREEGQGSFIMTGMGKSVLGRHLEMWLGKCQGFLVAVVGQCFFSVWATSCPHGKPSNLLLMGKRSCWAVDFTLPYLPAMLCLPKSTLQPNLPGQWPRKATSHCPYQSDQSAQFFHLICADRTAFLSAAPAEVGKQGFLQVILGCIITDVLLTLLLSSPRLHFNITSWWQLFLGRSWFTCSYPDSSFARPVWM